MGHDHLFTIVSHSCPDTVCASLSHAYKPSYLAARPLPMPSMFSFSYKTAPHEYLRRTFSVYLLLPVGRVHSHQDKIPPEIKPTHVESKPEGLEVHCEYPSCPSITLGLVEACQGRRLNRILHYIHGRGCDIIRMIHPCLSLPNQSAFQLSSFLIYNILISVPDVFCGDPRFSKTRQPSRTRRPWHLMDRVSSSGFLVSTNSVFASSLVSLQHRRQQRSFPEG